jgi:hypothetical protein
LVTPFCFQRTLAYSTPHVPLVRRAKSRNVGCSMLTQNAGEAALPVALTASDFESAAPWTLKDSLPDWTHEFVSDHAALPASKDPPGARV